MEGSKIAPAPSADSAPEARLKWGSYETAVSRVAKPNGFLPLKLRYLGRARSGAGNARLIARVDHLALGNDVSWPDFFWHLLAGSESSIRPKSCAPLQDAASAAGLLITTEAIITALPPGVLGSCPTGSSAKWNVSYVTG